MITPLRQMSELTSNVSFRLNLSIISVLLGLLFGAFFSWLWSDLSGMASLALWPLSLALALVLTTFLSARNQRELRWDLLFAGQISGVIGAAIFLFASI